MKKIKFAILALCAAMFCFAGCDELGKDPIVEDVLKDALIKTKLNSVGIDNATIQVNFAVVNELAYQVVEAEADNENTIEAEAVFANGTPIELTEGQSVVRLNLTDLTPDCNYVVYVAGRLVLEGKTYVFPTVVELALTTYAQPVMTAEVISVGATAVKFDITSSQISKYAYLPYRLKEAPEAAPSADIIFATGVVGEITEAVQSVTVNALMPNNDYIIYIAGEVAELEEYHSEILKLEGIKTQDFGEAYKVHSIDYASFKVDVKLPDSLAELNHIVKYGAWDLYTFNLNHKFGKVGRPESFAQSINLHESVYKNQIRESQTMTFSNETAFVTDENGDVYYTPEEEGGYALQIHSVFVPNQPTMLIMGEYRYGDHELYANFTDGYYQPLFYSEEYMKAIDKDNSVASNQLPWWYGFAVQELVTTKAPEEFDGKVDFEVILSEDNNNTKAKVRFTPSEEVEQYCVWIIAESMRGEILPMLDNDEKYLQWFVTSQAGFNEGAMSFFEATEVNLNTIFVEGALTSKNKFYAYVVAMAGGDKDGDGICDADKQSFVRYEFKLGERKLPDAKVDITVLESSPDMVRFNIKKAKDSARVAQLYYIANYEREWLGAGVSPETLLDFYGNPLSATELAMINSDDGFTIEFPARPNSTTYFAAKAYNAEGYFTYTDTFKATSAVTDPANRVESEYFTSLDGDWTATATIRYNTIVDEDTGEIGTITETKTSKVSIGKQTYPEVLPQSVYDTYAKFGISKEATDNYFAELTEGIDRFNEDARNRNQIICNGWEFDMTGETKDEYRSAFDLFCSEDYNGWSSTAPLYDFGPKWYIEFDANGNAWVPFNVNAYVPMSSWTTTNNGLNEYVNEYHMIAYDSVSETTALYPYFWNEEGEIIDGKFPVEISEDGNTITIKPWEIENYKFYPNMGAVYNESYTQFTFGSSIISEIVLTRGYTAQAKAKRVYNAEPQIVNNPNAVSPVARTYSLSNFTTDVTKYNVVEDYKIRTAEEYRETTRKRFEEGFYRPLF